MNILKKIVLNLLIILIVTACQPATATPVTELASYYGTPQPAKVIIDEVSYDSEVGSALWIYLDENGNPYGEIGDAFAVITPVKPIITKIPFSLTLKLPIPINPTELWYVLFEVLNMEESYNPDGQSLRWNRPPQEQIFPPFLHEQDLTFSPAPGTYVLEIWSGWGGEKPHVTMRADYGFLIEVQE